MPTASLMASFAHRNKCGSGRSATHRCHHRWYSPRHAAFGSQLKRQRSTNSFTAKSPGYASEAQILHWRKALQSLTQNRRSQCWSSIAASLSPANARWASASRHKSPMVRPWESPGSGIASVSSGAVHHRAASVRNTSPNSILLGSRF
jgi:hypothetical protein